jgi:hypothetical protein
MFLHSVADLYASERQTYYFFRYFGSVFTESGPGSRYVAESGSGSSLLLITDLVRIRIVAKICYERISKNL